jgi:hypothetical protein
VAASPFIVDVRIGNDNWELKLLWFNRAPCSVVSSISRWSD